jgi:cyclopropane fatty-acyl-phospholipid synthase-like methyltransferase
VSDPKEVVRRGYDAIAGRYNAWADSFETPEREWIDKLLARLSPGADVLDLGCGGGRRGAQALAAAHRYTGVDISEAQLRRARERISEATFLQADVTDVVFAPSGFDAVVSLFMFGHVPRQEQEPLLRKIATWLRPGGWFLATLGTGGTDDVVEDDWLGTPMFFASFDVEENDRMLARVGLAVDEARVVPFEEPGHGLVSFMWVLATRAE